ncbi:ATP-binding cassette domain-containing protein [Litoreibacter ascidiaceicola]|uniref:ATP-binding cassette domain-containing protein n=1 Tax=Litoreibacter ascidiaceicola TaxID=1486859 RepID=UPI000933207D|nr:ATP-binding cassette domain-containing protein [Litoreibacter ascidiaceicola]
MVSNLFPLRLSDAQVRRRGKTILGPVNLELDGQGLTIIVGPNGAGKTSLLRVMHGVERLSGGTVQWGMNDDCARERQAYVFQSPIMLRRSVADNLHYPLRLSGMARGEATPLVADWLARIGLQGQRQMQATRLSGGERQKLALARALIRQPEVLFLDEPCANLDGRATREFETLLLATRDSGTRIVMATHDLGQAKRLATDALFILGGRIHDSAAAPAFFDTPKTPELASFLRGDIVE